MVKWLQLLFPGTCQLQHTSELAPPLSWEVPPSPSPSASLPSSSLRLPAVAALSIYLELAMAGTDYNR